MVFNQVTTVEQVNALDELIMMRGYFAGLKNNPNFTERDQAYWHGYLNGQADGGHMPISDEQRALARAVVAKQQAKH